MLTAIVIVNFRTPALTIDCLASLALEAPANDAHVWVVDNCSGDDSAVAIRSAIETRGWGSWVTFIEADKNGGFAAGNNIALKAILAMAEPSQFTLLLNPDTIVRPGAIGELIRFQQANPKVGIAGSRLEHADATAQISAFRFPTFLSELEYGMSLGIVTKLLGGFRVPMAVEDAPHRADWVAGASMLIRTDLLRQVGLLDDAYFMYYEEVDFCRRALDAGWECWYVPTSRVIHLVGQASGLDSSRHVARRMPLYWFDSRARYFNLHHGRPYRFAADVAWSIGHALFCARNLVQKKHSTFPPKLLSDFVSYNFFDRVPQ